MKSPRATATATKPTTKLRGFTKPRNRLTLRGPHLDNLTFNFKGATRRSAPFRFTSPCLKCDPLAARHQPATLVIGDVLKRLVAGDSLCRFAGSPAGLARTVPICRHLGTFLSCRQLGTVLKGRIDQLRKAHSRMSVQHGVRFPLRPSIGKCIPDYCRKAVPSFPNGPLTESAPRYWAPKQDALSVPAVPGIQRPLI